MDTMDLQAFLRRRLEGDSVVLRHPDHPYLAEGPELLVGASHQLTAVFAPKQTEILAHPERLLARLALTRLALPADTRTALYAERGDVGRLHLHFDEVFSSREEQHLVRFLASAAPRRPSFPMGLQRMAYARAHLFVRESRLLYAKHDARYPVRERFAELAPKRVTSSLWVENDEGIKTRQVPLYATHHGIATFLTDRELSPNSVKLVRFSQLLVQQQFAIDNGILYPRQTDPSLVLASSPPLGKQDPGKPRRAAAFAGWLLAPPVETDDLVETLKVAQRRVAAIRKRWYQ